jgi:hypothetical protein
MSTLFCDLARPLCTPTPTPPRPHPHTLLCLPAPPSCLPASCPPGQSPPPRTLSRALSQLATARDCAGHRPRHPDCLVGFEPSPPLLPAALHHPRPQHKPRAPVPPSETLSDICHWPSAAANCRRRRGDHLHEILRAGARCSCHYPYQTWLVAAAASTSPRPPTTPPATL